MLIQTLKNSKLAGIESLADVTDEENVSATFFRNSKHSKKYISK